VFGHKLLSMQIFFLACYFFCSLNLLKASSENGENHSKVEGIDVSSNHSEEDTIIYDDLLAKISKTKMMNHVETMIKTIIGLPIDQAINIITVFEEMIAAQKKSGK
jgi:DNA relaxase NicK